ncbi:MAG: hypothetical protein AAFZ58_11280 [Pseudomonadota bacterium]
MQDVLLGAAILTVLLAAMHSILGGRRLIGPLAARDDLPVILGSIVRTRVTLHVGWHALSLLWIGMAALMALMHWAPTLRSPAFLWMTTAVFGVLGLAALLLSQGRHLSWLMFLPIAVLTGRAASS